MGKFIKFIFLFVFIIMLVGCMGQKEGQLTRVDAQRINSDGNYGEIVMITDKTSIEIIRTVLKSVKWEPNTEAKMSRKADVRATLFFEFDENMPERLVEYQIWLNKEIVTIISDNPKEGYSEMDKESLGILKSDVFNKKIDIKNN